MSTLGAREANCSVSKILRGAESAKTMIVARNGRAVARLGPAALRPTSEKQRRDAHRRLMKLLEQGLDFGGRKFTRDELHER